MVHTTHGNFGRTPVERIARALLSEARQDPALLGRTHAPRRTSISERLELPLASGGALQPIRYEHPAPVEFEQHLEDLVSIAVASARQAEDACEEVRAASQTAHRGMILFAGFGVLGVLLALAAVVDQHLHNRIAVAATPTEIAEPATSAPNTPSTATAAGPRPTEPGTANSGAASLATADAPPADAGGSGLLIPTASAQPVMRAIVPPVYHGPVSGYAPPWPSERRVGYTANVSNRRVVVPQFFVTVQRDLGALFRGLAPHS